MTERSWTANRCSWRRRAIAELESEEGHFSNIWERHFYNQFMDGNWVDPKLLGALPDGPGSHLSTADFAYPAHAQHRLWQVWIESDTADPTLELEINYPPDVWQRSDGRGYMFRLAMQWAANEADRVNEACSNELPEEEGTVLPNQRNQLLILRVPHSSDR